MRITTDAATAARMYEAEIKNLEDMIEGQYRAVAQREFDQQASKPLFGKNKTLDELIAEKKVNLGNASTYIPRYSWQIQCAHSTIAHLKIAHARDTVYVDVNECGRLVLG